MKVGNPADGGVAYWLLKMYGFAIAVILAAIVAGAVGTGRYLASKAPPAPDFRKYAKVAPAVTRMYAADGTLLGEFAKEWRGIVPFEKMPKQLVNAFLAVEDHDFFHHGGIYVKGIARAAWANLTSGDFQQGGSTITQQVAKQFLGGEKSLTRKAKEAVMARRLEATYSKQAILSVYLNQIYLGAGAWGVGAAAHRYFQKDLDQLTLAESALIAGLAKAPTGNSPMHHPVQAVRRRNKVLDRMQQNGFATAAEVAAAKAEPLHLNLYKDVFPDRMPYYAEHVRRYVTDTYGLDGLMANGYTIETAVEPTLDAAAYPNVDFGARHQDKRQGWRGPEWTVDGAAKEMFITRQRERYGSGPLSPDKRYLALVEKVTSEGAKVRVGDRKLELPLRNMSWAAPWQPGNAPNDQQIGSATRALKSGDIIWVSREIHARGRFRDWGLPDGHNPSWMGEETDHDWDDKHPDVVQLEQVPHPQAAIFTADHHTGYVVAMVGGYDYDRSVFNRAVQACRSPGSTYKPIYYSLGLDQGYGYDTVLNDVPPKIEDPITHEIWTPTNLDDTLDGDVTLEYALVYSKNIPSVDLFQRLGAKNVEAWARRLGFTTKIIADDALALGASCTRMDELSRAFSVFARGGKWYPRAKNNREWIYVRRVLDRDGNAIEDNTVFYDAQLKAGDRFDRIYATVGLPMEQTISERTAYLTTKLLSQMVKFGFTSTLRATGINAAGKTGTSSATSDTTFVAFTSRFITTVWLGDDKKERALGAKDAAFMTVIPMWARYMNEAYRNFPNPDIPWSLPVGQNPNDRGDHSKGVHGPQMDLVYHHPEKPADDADSTSTDGTAAPSNGT